MGNCQAIDAASIVIQHPNGKVERLYCPLTARQIMDANPTHYVALLVSTTLSPPVIHTSVSSSASHQNQNGHIHSKTTDTKDQNLPILHTRIKILKPTETLVLGQVYRLITAEEVMKGLWAKKQARMKNSVSDQSQKPPAKENLQLQGRKCEGEGEGEGGRRRRGNIRKSGTGKGRTWKPSLQSISEATS